MPGMAPGVAKTPPPASEIRNCTLFGEEFIDSLIFGETNEMNSNALCGRGSKLLESNDKWDARLICAGDELVLCFEKSKFEVLFCLQQPKNQNLNQN
jgi:hypothetical protein